MCGQRGAAVELRRPDDDNRLRHICISCGTIHYQNPNMVIGSIPEWEDKILLCRRAIEPRHGLWTLPGGFMENGETTTEAAIRETLEEANARIEIGDLFSMYSLPFINQVHLLFRAQLLDLDFSPGSESLEVRLFTENEIPWDEIAGMRDRCVHGYESVDFDIVWDVATVNLPPLLAELENIMPPDT